MTLLVACFWQAHATLFAVQTRLSWFAYCSWPAAHVVRADRLFTCCDAGVLGDEQRLVFEFTALAPLRQTYAVLFTDRLIDLYSKLAQQTRRHCKLKRRTH